jgi:long-chain acyl-CoA synthetase
VTQLREANCSAIMSGMVDVPETIVAFLANTLSSRGDEQALGFIRGGQLHWRIWREVAEDACRLAAEIQAAGIVPGDRVAHISENRYEWIITDLAIHLARAVHVPIQVSLSGQQIAEQISDCGAGLVFVSSRELFGRFEGLIDSELPVLLHDEWRLAATEPVAGAAKPQAMIDTCLGATRPEDLATILFTSGTTGRPRGVMLSQRNLAVNSAITAETIGGDIEQMRLNVLPLSHIFARTCDLYTWLYRGTRLVLAENRETLFRDLQLVRPDGLSAVPYLYQRAADKVREIVRESDGGEAEEAAKLKALYGGRMERLTSGGAPLSPETEAWYRDRGLPILAGYGLTESSPVISMSTQTVNRFSSSGRPLAGVDVRIAGDGEILNRGPNTMMGYWNDPAATAAAIRDGWLHTGDLGELDADGFLYVRGRKKELIVLATGKKVVPTRVEGLLTGSPLIEQAVVFGEGQCGIVALIVPAACGLVEGIGSDATRDRYVAEINRCLKSAAHEEQIRHFAILDRPFSIERGEMTPKLSLRREIIACNYADQLAALNATNAHGQLSRTTAAKMSH